MTWLPINEAVQVLAVSERTVYRRISAGELQTRKEGGRVLVDVGPEQQRQTVAGTVRHLAEVSTASVVQQAQQQEGLARQLSDMADWRDQLQGDLQTARVETKWLRRWLAAICLAGVVSLSGGGFGWLRQTGRHKVELETVRIELSDQRGQATVLSAQVRDREQRLDQARTELVETAGELAAVNEQRDSAVGDRDRLAAELSQARAAIEAEHQARAKAVGGLLSRLVRSLTTRPVAEPSPIDS